MTPEQFAYWLQGYAELNTQPPTPEQWKMIRDHLGTVFNKITPKLGEYPELNSILNSDMVIDGRGAYC